MLKLISVFNFSTLKAATNTVAKPLKQRKAALTIVI